MIPGLMAPVRSAHQRASLDRLLDATIAAFATSLGDDAVPPPGPIVVGLLPVMRDGCSLARLLARQEDLATLWPLYYDAAVAATTQRRSMLPHPAIDLLAMAVTCGDRRRALEILHLRDRATATRGDGEQEGAASTCFDVFRALYVRNRQQALRLCNKLASELAALEAATGMTSRYRGLATLGEAVARKDASDLKKELRLRVGALRQLAAERPALGLDLLVDWPALAMVTLAERDGMGIKDLGHDTA